jgi:hypothetical protein
VVIAQYQDIICVPFRVLARLAGLSVLTPLQLLHEHSPKLFYKGTEDPFRIVASSFSGSPSSKLQHHLPNVFYREVCLSHRMLRWRHRRSFG